MQLRRVDVKQKRDDRLALGVVDIQRRQTEVDVAPNQGRHDGFKRFGELWIESRVFGRQRLRQIRLVERNGEVRPLADNNFYFVDLSVPVARLGVEAQHVVRRILVEHRVEAALDVVVIAEEFSAGVGGDGPQAVLRFVELGSLVVQKFSNVAAGVYLIGGFERKRIKSTRIDCIEYHV